MKSYHATGTIDAEPDVIWAILTDGPLYRLGSGVVRVEGRIAPGEIAAGLRKRAETGT
jgi:hypothetical protein